MALNCVLVVSAYIPLPVKHLTEAQYRELGSRLAAATEPYKFVKFEHRLDECWLAKEEKLPRETAFPVPSDRYSSAEDNIKSHIIQHNRTEWGLRAADEYTGTDVIVWFDYGLMKQGMWNGNPITPEHVRAFLDRVAHFPFERTMPFPGIEAKKPIEPFGHNWRFVGSTHIWPVKWLPAIDRVYKRALRDFLGRYERVPLDLAIWPEVENRCALEGPDHVPFEWYKAEYDASQITAFPERETL